ncbi:hypothetical protein, partial [Elioraea tepidiphila]|uniref:hypothetical protein n=1 Tax=Elioraea tepidiphila TaxID=457934 RepID=UPI001B7FAC3A
MIAMMEKNLTFGCAPRNQNAMIASPCLLIGLVFRTAAHDPDSQARRCNGGDVPSGRPSVSDCGEAGRREPTDHAFDRVAA